MCIDGWIASVDLTVAPFPTHLTVPHRTAPHRAEATSANAVFPFHDGRSVCGVVWCGAPRSASAQGLASAGEGRWGRAVGGIMPFLSCLLCFALRCLAYFLGFFLWAVRWRDG